MKKIIWILVAIAAVFLIAGSIAFLASGRLGGSKSAGNVPVVFSIHAPEAKTVFVCGGFNSWKTIEFLLEKKENGDWETTIPIPPGRYEYKFVVDSVWVCDPNNPVKVPVPMPGTGYNSVLEVKSPARP
jgi:1,4-alpha-glucan branching enzyme